MLLDHMFKTPGPQEIVIIRKDGKLKHVTRPLPQTVDNDESDKPLFPISKDRS
jgi:hypothetical protein